MSDVAKLAAGLTKAQRKAVHNASPGVWEPACALLGSRPGNTVRICADKGFFESQSDPWVWGRSQYRLTPLGEQVRAYLIAQEQG